MMKDTRVELEDIGARESFKGVSYLNRLSYRLAGNFEFSRGGIDRHWKCLEILRECYDCLMENNGDGRKN